MVKGDRNTKFFHTSTIARRSHNKIVRIRNSGGDWITESTLISQHIQKGFSELFTTSHISSLDGICLPL